MLNTLHHEDGIDLASREAGKAGKAGGDNQVKRRQASPAFGAVVPGEGWMWIAMTPRDGIVCEGFLVEYIEIVIIL